MFCSCEDSCWRLASRRSPIICASEPANQCKLQTSIEFQPVSASSTLSKQQGLNWTGISWALEAHVPAVFNLHSHVFKAFSREMVAKMDTQGFARQTDKYPFAWWDFCRSGKTSKCDLQLAEDRVSQKTQRELQKDERRLFNIHLTHLVLRQPRTQAIPNRNNCRRSSKQTQFKQVQNSSSISLAAALAAAEPSIMLQHHLSFSTLLHEGRASW
jgi:hypothetical protein